MSARRTVFAGVLLLAALPAISQTYGVKKRTPKPEEFGNVVMNNYAARLDSDPVVFPHWLHRAKYTCRLCHVDLGFAMVARETQVSEADNRAGLYCGACHNGRIAFASEEQTAEGPKHNCLRCHSGGPGAEPELKYDFHEFTKDLPRARFGNRVDWLIAEEEGLIKLEDYLEGISIERPALKAQEDRNIHSTVEGIPDIIFSHEKHTVWSGCELCHPQIFGLRRGSMVYDMQDIFDGMYCGACHGKVAFPNEDCQLCHTEPLF